MDILEPGTSDRVPVLGEGFLDELDRVLDLVEGFLGELKLVLVLVCGGSHAGWTCKDFYSVSCWIILKRRCA